MTDMPRRRHEYWLRESRFYDLIDRDKDLVRCGICERRCMLRPGDRGFCGVNQNMDGKLYSTSYGLLSAIEPRPIEIKPLFHYYPNSIALTFSGWSCNFKCPWCQNYMLSFSIPIPEYSITMSPEELVEETTRRGCQGICASFNEPTINADYLVDVGIVARNRNVYLSLVTNGYMSIRVLRSLLDAGYTGFSIDIKGCPETYRRFIHGDPEIVYRNARYVMDNGGHVEMVFLVVTGANDDPECIEWVIDKHLEYLGEDVPLHINRYYPANKYHEPPTEITKLLETADYARRSGIRYVYVGNIGSSTHEATRCPRCGKILIARSGYRVVKWSLTSDNRCPRCGFKIPIYGRPHLPG